MTTPNRLALPQAQAAQRSPSLAGPIAPQTPTPDFRQSALTFAPAPQLPEPQQISPEQVMKSFSGLMNALQPGCPEDPGVAAQKAAIAADPFVQANPSTSAAGMLASTNPDVGIGGSMRIPPNGGSGVGISPYGRPGFFLRLLHSLGLLNFSQ
jgi:hypothetical protein